MEEEKYDDLLQYFEEQEQSVPLNINKRRAMRFLCGNNYNMKKSYQNIIKTVEWMKEIKPMRVDEDMKKFLDMGFQYIHGRDRHLRPIFYINAYLLKEIDVDVDVVFKSSWFS
mmetsp:Transcript_5693/g.4899  ORF Transcript_5693/g.4899 Transcript_5693/m.4899 type:complete len:113 (+) Transcript_5693:247-585(+)